MFTKKYDFTSKDILDQFEVDYEAVENVLLDIKREVDKELDRNPHVKELVYYTYVPLSHRDMYYIETHLLKLYSIELVEYVYTTTTDLFCNDVMKFKLLF